MPVADLSLLETEQLMNELGKRFDGFIVAGVQHRTDEDDGITVFYKGSFITCVGLSEVIANDMTLGLQALRDSDE